MVELDCCSIIATIYRENVGSCLSFLKINDRRRYINFATSLIMLLQSPQIKLRLVIDLDSIVGQWAFLGINFEHRMSK